MPTRVVFDTDLGTDVDDCLALALILGSPELALEGITCVHGAVGLRARMARKLLGLRGRADVPVMVGVEQPILGRRPIYWPGHEGTGLLGPEDEALEPDPEPAVDYLVRVVMANPGQIHLLAVGPLTNVALAFLAEPRLGANLAHLTIMGGALRGPDRLELPYGEHNIVLDPEAAEIVLAAGAPTTLVPLDVTTRVAIRPEGAARIRAGGTPFHEAVAGQVEVYPPFAARGWTNLHDPLAAAVVVRPDLVAFRDLHVDVETEGRHSAGATLMRAPSEAAPANARVALAVDVAAAEAFMLARLSG